MDLQESQEIVVIQETPVLRVIWDAQDLVVLMDLLVHRAVRVQQGVGDCLVS